MGADLHWTNLLTMPEVEYAHADNGWSATIMPRMVIGPDRYQIIQMNAHTTTGTLGGSGRPFSPVSASSTSGGTLVWSLNVSAPEVSAPEILGVWRSQPREIYVDTFYDKGAAMAEAQKRYDKYCVLKLRQFLETTTDEP